MKPNAAANFKKESEYNFFFIHDCRDQNSTSFVLLFANFKVICDLKCKKLFALCHMEWKFQIIKQNEDF